MASQVQLFAPAPKLGTGPFCNNPTTLAPERNGLLMVANLSLRILPMTRPRAHTLGQTLLEFRAAPHVGKCVKFQAVTETLHPCWPSLEDVAPSELNLAVETARSEDKLRAAATLRARSFYTYPEGRSIDALKVHQKMKADEEWSTLTRKVGGMEPGYKHTTCLIAFCPVSDLLDVCTDLHSHCKITPSPGEECLVVGTLDISQGHTLPGELPGDHPEGSKAEHCRAYLSNVCVAQEVRRRGVGTVLIQHIKNMAKQWGVSDLYVHVVVDNMSARHLYEKAGFLYEKEETVKHARRMFRPRRFLLRAQL